MSEHICVIGLGYIGLPTAIMFVKHGFELTGVDVNPDVIDMLKGGSLHIHEEGLVEAFTRAVSTKKFAFTSKPVVADVFIIAVPTPFNTDKTADMSYVISAARSILPVLKKGDMVILESTSPPRTTLDLLMPLLEESGLKCGPEFDLVYSPERVLPGRILEELVQNDRIVGGQTPEAADRAKKLYSTFVRGQIHSTDPTTAEMVKLMENTYRDVNIALANEFSRIAVEQKIDVWEAIRLANFHPRVSILRPGPGVGGHCISVDPWFLVQVSPDSTDLIKTARRVNDLQPEFLLKTLKAHVGELKGRKVTVLGLAYKPDIDDLRESSAVDFARMLVNEGAVVGTFEPFAVEFQVADGSISYSNIEEALADTEIVAVVVGHSEFRCYDAEYLFEASGLESKDDFLIFDSTNLIPNTEDGEITVVRLGDGS